MYIYGIIATPDDNGSVMITCPLLPEVTSFAERDDVAKIKHHASHAINEAVAARIKAFDDIPLPNHDEGLAVRLDTQLSLKASLVMALRQNKMNRAALSRISGKHRHHIDRLFNPNISASLKSYDEIFALFDKMADTTYHAAS